MAGAGGMDGADITAVASATAVDTVEVDTVIEVDTDIAAADTATELPQDIEAVLLPGLSAVADTTVTLVAAMSAADSTVAEPAVASTVVAVGSTAVVAEASTVAVVAAPTVVADTGKA